MTREKSGGRKKKIFKIFAGVFVAVVVAVIAILFYGTSKMKIGSSNSALIDAVWHYKA